MQGLVGSLPGSGRTGAMNVHALSHLSVWTAEGAVSPSCLGVHPFVLVRRNSHRPLFSRPSYLPAQGTRQVASG